jgi:hypothetical protein
LSGSPFLAIMVGLFLVAGAFALWIELLMREAAVYVIVLMLPLAFAALVWPARRIWAIRAVELLAALILSKFAIVAVLSLGGAALSAGTGHGLTAAMVGVVLLIMGAFAPWALLRLLPLAELASSAVGSLRSEMRGAVAPSLTLAAGTAGAGEDWATSTTARMRRDASDTSREEAAQDATQGARDADPGPDAPDADPGQDARDADPGQDARDATSGPPARHEGLDENGDRVRPQGGRQAASQAVPENLEAPASEPEDPGVATARTDTPASEPDDPGPILQEMWRDEHRGKHKPSLGDDPPPPPDIEQS